MVDLKGIVLRCRSYACDAHIIIRHGNYAKRYLPDVFKATATSCVFGGRFRSLGVITIWEFSGLLFPAHLVSIGNRAGSVGCYR
jgi:hypothetical protein